MQFVKMHGCGNDYVLVNENDVRGYSYPELAKKISDRKEGVGSDGLIVVGKSEQADLRMYMYNSDGSRGKMCGNGIRLLGKYAFERKLTIKTKLRVETDSGIKKLSLHTDGAHVISVTVDMGEPVFDTKKIPVRTDAECILDRKVSIGGKFYNMSCVSMGNPHAVIHVSESDLYDIFEDGSRIENDRMFPDRVNVMFVETVSDDYIQMNIWERGSGVTLACGSGACAAFAACYATGRCGKQVKVCMPGGTVEVSYDEAGKNIILNGDANEVYTGEYLL